MYTGEYNLTFENSKFIRKGREKKEGKERKRGRKEEKKRKKGKRKKIKEKGGKQEVKN